MMCEEKNRSETEISVEKGIKAGYVSFRAGYIDGAFSLTRPNLCEYLV
jgi:hypothetical protein